MASGQGLAALRAHLAKATYEERLSTLEDVEVFLRKCYPSLDVQRADVDVDGKGTKKTWVIVCTPRYTCIESGDAGPIQPARMVFNDDGAYAFQVLLHTVQQGTWSGSTQQREITGLLDKLLANSRSVYMVCPGIRDYDATFGQFIRFESKNLRVWKNPLKRHDSKRCLLWHKPANTRQQPDSPTYNLCGSCKLLYHNLVVIKKRAVAAPQAS